MNASIMLRNILVLLCLLMLQGSVMGRGLSPINESTPGFSAVPGDYKATQVTIPLGPYIIEFSTRLENATYEGSYTESCLNRSSGSGKSYHTNTYDVATFVVNDGNTRINIYHQVSPAGETAVDPYPCGYDDCVPLISSSTYGEWTTGSSSPAKIDGRTGTHTLAQLDRAYPDYMIRTIKERYVYAYQLDDNTFATLYSDEDYAKEVSLLEETLHISSRWRQDD
jgi:hypothetical protein